MGMINSESSVSWHASMVQSFADLGLDSILDFVQYYAFVEEKQKVHCLNTLFSKVSIPFAAFSSL